MQYFLFNFNDRKQSNRIVRIFSFSFNANMNEASRRFYRNILQQPAQIVQKQDVPSSGAENKEKCFSVSEADASQPPLSFVSVIRSSGIILDHQDEVLVLDGQRTLSTLAPGEGESEAVASAAVVCFQVKH